VQEIKPSVDPFLSWEVMWSDNALFAISLFWIWVERGADCMRKCGSRNFGALFSTITDIFFEDFSKI
jgi:hypothetical protein